jgi:hypothetical protein
VVPYPHDIKGEGIYAYVTLREVRFVLQTVVAFKFFSTSCCALQFDVSEL